MCGISGIVGKGSFNSLQELRESLRLINHRGPDGNNISSINCSNLLLGHTRLSILDLTNNGDQPFIAEDKQYAITFNGEIYNYLELRENLIRMGYRFKSTCDTEVLLYHMIHYGSNGLEKLEGMFAFAFINLKANTVLLARDQSGEKPLYFWRKNGNLIFCSELKGILAFRKIQKQLDLESLNHYLEFGYSDSCKTLIKDVEKLKPGHFLEQRFDANNCVIKKFFEINHNQVVRNEAKINYVDELDKLIEISLRKQLRSDVPVGFLLSGGLDSSIIVSIAKRVNQNIKTFTVSNPNSRHIDESAVAKRLSNYLSTQHFELPFDYKEYGKLDEILDTFDEPIGDTSVIPTYLLCRQIKKFCTVAIGGDGGDELFGGYNDHSVIQKLAIPNAIIPRGLKTTLKQFVFGSRPCYFKGRRYLNYLLSNLNLGLPNLGMFFDHYNRIKLCKKPFFQARLSNQQSEFSDKYLNCLLTRKLYHDYNNYLPENILVKTDRCSMANSLEMRAPFLDKNIVKFAFEQVPEKLKNHRGRSKIILRQLASQILPSNFEFGKKQGFSISINDVLNAPENYSKIKSILHQSPLLNKKYTNNLFAQFKMGQPVGDHIFLLYHLQFWINKNNILI